MLSYDWQNGSIPLVEDWRDWRNVGTLVFYTSLAVALLYSWINRKVSLSPLCVYTYFVLYLLRPSAGHRLLIPFNMPLCFLSRQHPLTFLFLASQFFSPYALTRCTCTSVSTQCSIRLSRRALIVVASRTTTDASSLSRRQQQK